MKAPEFLIDRWADWATSSLWQVTWLVVALVALDLLLRRRGWPQLRMALWMLVPLRLVLPPSIGSPLDLVSGVGAAAPAAVPVGADTTAVAADGISAAALLCAIWALGAATLLCAGYVSRRRARRRVLCPTAQRDVPTWLHELAVTCARRLDLRSVPPVMCTSRVAGAAVVGVLRPVVAVSADFVRTASRADVEHVLLHELSHVRRRDPLQRVIGEILCALYWFHPAVWLAGRRIEDLREVCCDATVASVLRADTAAYRRTLLRAGRMLLDDRSSHAYGQRGMLGWFRRPSQLLTRLAWLEAPTWERPARRRALTTAALAGMLAIAMPSAPARPEPLLVAPNVAVPSVAAPTGAGAGLAAVRPERSSEKPAHPSGERGLTPAGIAAARRLLSRVDDVHGRPGTHQLRAAANYLIWAGEYDPAPRDD